MSGYKFNKDQLRFVEERRSTKDWLKRIFKYLLASVLLAILYYFVISIVFSTEQERKIARENKLMEQEYLRLQEKLELLDNTVKNLQYKDKEIYKQIFNSEPHSHGDGQYGYPYITAIDTTRNDKIIEESAEKLKWADNEVKKVNDAFLVINSSFEKLADSVLFIPSIVPIKDFSISQTGASVGQKINPFYKTVVSHTGIDLLGASGADILASASGKVESVSRKGKKEGNTVVINHGNGYVTKYMQMGDILVRQGQNIEKGNVIGRIGMSGMSFAPHLHYEVSYNGKILEPINYFFSELTPNMYREMVSISSNTGQSLD